MAALRPIDRVLNRLDSVRGSGSGYIAKCPGHDDREPSLSIHESQGGTVLLHCHAGCPKDHILAKLDLGARDLFPPRNADSTALRGGKRSRIVACYGYYTEEGELCFQTVRFEPKDFRQRRPKVASPRNDHGQDWDWSLRGVRRILYRLPDLRAADRNELVYLVEGEKDADALAALGLITSCNVGGAGKWHDEYSEELRGRKVAILPDNDQPGREHAERVALSLHGIAAEVRVVQLSGLPPKGDVSDWLAAGGDAEQLRQFVAATPIWQKVAKDAEQCHTEEDGSLGARWQPWRGQLLSEVEEERVDWLSRGRLALGKITIVDGDPGQGKSTLVAEFMARTTNGEALPDGTARDPAGVVLLSAEDGIADTILPRLKGAGADLNRVLAINGIPDDGVPDDVSRDRLPAIPDDLPIIEHAIKRMKAKLLVIDPLMAYLHGDVNSFRDQDVRRALAPLAALAERCEVAVIIVRHLNKLSGGPAIYRGGGSIGIIGAARCGLLLASDPNDPERRILASTKSNLARPPASLAFKLESVPGQEVARVVWDGEVEHSATALLAPPESHEKQSKMGMAEGVLLGLLADGPQPSETVKSKAQAAGVAERTLARAKKRLDICSIKGGFTEGWLWELPKDASDSEDCRTKANGTLRAERQTSDDGPDFEDQEEEWTG